MIGTYYFMNSRSVQLFGNIINRVETDELVVALTFDDGPTEKTEAILDILNRNEIKATFYLTGKEIEAHPDLAKKIIEAGHEVGNHTYSHAKNVFKSPSFIENEILKTNELIRQMGYTGPMYFRSPYCKKLVILPYYLNKYGLTNITFDIEPDTYVETAAEKVDYTISEVQPGSIILLHPMYNDSSLDAIQGIIVGLKEQGYEFLTVSELLNK